MSIYDTKKFIDELKESKYPSNVIEDIKMYEDTLQKQENLLKEFVDQCEKLDYKTDCSKIYNIVNELLLEYYSNVNILYKDAIKYIKVKKYRNTIKQLIRVFIHLADEDDLDTFYYTTISPEQVLI